MLHEKIFRRVRLHVAKVAEDGLVSLTCSSGGLIQPPHLYHLVAVCVVAAKFDFGRRMNMNMLPILLDRKSVV